MCCRCYVLAPYGGHRFFEPIFSIKFHFETTKRAFLFSFFLSTKTKIYLVRDHVMAELLMWTYCVCIKRLYKELWLLLGPFLQFASFKNNTESKLFVLSNNYDEFFRLSSWCEEIYVAFEIKLLMLHTSVKCLKKIFSNVF